MVCGLHGKQQKYNMAMMRLDGKAVRKLVHHIVLEAFIGPRPDGMVGCHANDIGDDNRLENLRWDLPSANYRDRDNNGRTIQGVRQHLAKLTDSKVLQIRDMAANGELAPNIARLFAVSSQNIHDVAAGRTWKHVGGPLTEFGRRSKKHMEIT